MKQIASAAAVAASLFIGATAAAQQTQPVREITKIAGEVYRFRNNFHYSVFAVTPAGVIATDPINAAAAKWLKDEIRTRFNQPIRYVIYSHDHADHIAGGEVLAEGALVVAHVNAKEKIVGEKRPTAVPHITFTDTLALELGGTVVELAYVGKNHSDNSIVVRFPREGILFAVDFIPVKSVAFRNFPDGYMPDWIESLKRVERMEFAILAPGHGPLGNKADVVAHRGYLEELHAAVLAGARAGKTLDQLKEEIKLEKYQGWALYQDFRPLNVEGMYRMVEANRRGN